MIFDCTQAAALAETREIEGAGPLALDGAGLWVGVLLGGRCMLEADGAAQTATAGDVLAGAGPLVLRPLAGSRWRLARLTGQVPALFLRGLGGARILPGAACPGAAELLDRLEAPLPAAAASRLCYELLCLLGAADEPVRALPPLVAEALADIRENYMALYGVEELSEQLGVSKCHLVRVFSAAVGMPPGKYLVRTRVEAAQQLLLAGEHDLETVAALCGFSGANYLCRVFKRETGLSPAAWRAANAGAPRTALPLPQQDAIYV